MSNNDSRLARTIVRELLRDMLNRRGFRQNWDAIDENIRNEILAKWESIVAAALAADAAQGKETR